MAWTYSGDPASSNLDAVRYYIGDTDTTDQLLTNAEINFEVAEHGNALGAALSCCMALAAKFARQADYKIGPEQVWASQRATQYRALYKELKVKKGPYKAAPVGAPTNVTGTPIFGIGQFDSVTATPGLISDSDEGV